MWSKNPIPVEISARPLPSRSIDSTIVVSFVLRETVAERFMEVSIRVKGS